MKLSDFKIGEKFWTVSGRWICTDIGTRTVTAYLEEDMHGMFHAPARPWDEQDNTVFYPYDLEGCRPNNNDF